MVLLLLFHDSTVVVDENKGVFELGVVVSACSSVSRAEIALHVVNMATEGQCSGANAYLLVILRERGLGGLLLLASGETSVTFSTMPVSTQDSLPWSLCAMRRNQYPAAPEQVEAPVGDFVQDGVGHGGWGELVAGTA